MSVVVRRVGAEAAAEVLAVVQSAFGARPPLDPPADALGEDERSIARLLARRGGFLATVDDVPVGCVILDPTPDGLVLRRFGVVPTAQGTGVATALVEAAVDVAAGRRGREGRRPRGAAGDGRLLGAARLRGDRAGTARTSSSRCGCGTSFDCPDADTMRRLGERVGRSLVAGDLVVLTGELGAGKTTFTQGLGAGLDVRGGVTSPTFVIARVHPSLVGGPDLVHVDAYRLGGLDELDDLDLDASLDSAVTVVEWGAGIAEGLAESHLEVVIERAVGHAPDDELDPRRVSLRWVVGQ